MVLGDVDSYMQKNETQPPTYTIYKTNSRWIKELNISCDIRKVIEDNRGRKISDIPHSNIFTNISPRARDMKERINKWDLINLKSFCTSKKTSAKWKENQLYGKTYLPMIPWTKFWSPKYIKNSHNLIPGRQTIQFKNGQRAWTDTSPRRTCRGPRDRWKDA